MNRKLKKALVLVDHWLALEVGCRFVRRRRAGYETLRQTDDYLVTINNPDRGGRTPQLEIVADEAFFEAHDKETQAILAHNEVMLFKTFMIFKDMDEQGLRLDKKSRDRLQAYLAQCQGD